MAGSFVPDSIGVQPQPARAPSFVQDPEPSWGDVFSALPTNIAAHLQQAVGGWVQQLGDLSSKVYADSGGGMSRAGAGMAESGRISTELGVPQNMSTGQEIVLGGVSSAAETLMLAPLRVPGIILGMGAITEGQTYADMRAAGFEPGRSFTHAAFEGLVEAGTELLPARALFGSHKNILARTIAVMTREVPSELVATALQDASAKLSRNPNMTLDEFVHDLIVTAGATAIGVPIQAGAVHGAMRLARAPVPQQIVPTVLPDSTIMEPPQYTDTGTNVKEQGAGIDTTNPIGWMQQLEGISWERGRRPESVELTGTVFATDRFRRIKEAQQNGEPTTPGDMLWAKWYERTNGISVGNDLVVAQPITAIEQASQALEKAAKEAPVLKTTDGGLIVPTVVGAQSTTRLVEPQNEKVVVRDLEKTSPVPVRKIDGTEPVRVEERQQNVKPDQKWLDSYNASSKVTLDKIDVTKDGSYYIVNGFVQNPARGDFYQVMNARVPAIQMLDVIGPQWNAVTEKVDRSVRTDSANVNSAYIQAERKFIVDKAEAIRGAIEEHGIAVPGFISRVKSVPAIMPSSSTADNSWLVVGDKEKRMYGSYKVQHDAGKAVLLSNASEVSPVGTRLQKVAQAWLDKYMPNTRLALIYSEAPAAGVANALGWMKQDHQGIYYVSVNPKGLAERQYQTLAHEFGHMLLTEMFYKAPHATQAALFQQYQEFINRVPNMTIGEFIRERFDMSWSEGASSVYNENDPASKLIADIDARQSQGYTLSFDEYFAEQFAKYVAEPTAHEFAADPGVQSLMREAYRRLKEFFSGLSIAFREGASFRKWVDGLALDAKEVREAMKGGNEQNKLLARLRKSGMSEQDINELRDYDGTLIAEEVNKILAGESRVTHRKANNEDDANETWNQVLNGSDTMFEGFGFRYWQVGDEVQQPAYPGQPAQVIAVIPITHPDKRGPEIYRVRIDVRGHSEGIDENGMPVEFKEQTFRSNELRGKDEPVGAALVDFPGALTRWATRENQPEVASAVTRFGKTVGKFMSLLQVNKLNGHVPGVNKFTEGMRRMFATKARWTSVADTRLEEWKALGKEQSEKLSKILLQEASEAKFVGAVVQNGTSTREQTYTLEGPELERLGLRAEAATLYGKIHTDYLNALNAMERTGVHEMWRIYDPDTYYAAQRAGMTEGDGIFSLAPTHPLLAQHIQTLQQDYARLREHPYMPFTRFGRYAVLIKADDATVWRGRDFKAGQTVYFAAFETKREADEHAKKMRADTEHLPLLTASQVYIKDEEYNMRGLPPALVDSLQARLQLQPEQAKALRDILASMTSSRAFVQHLQKREGVLGYSEDVQRVYADYFLRFANYQSRLEHGHELDKALDEVAKSSRSITDAGGDATKRDLLHEWLYRNREYVMKPKDELEDVRGALTVAYLAFNVKSALINGFQVPFVTIPYLSSRSSWKDASAVVTRTYKDVFASWKTPSTLSDEEWGAMQRGLSEGFLDESFAATLANIAEGGNLLRAIPVSRVGKGWEHFKTKGMWMFQRMEEINRRVTFMSSYRLSREKGTSIDQAFQDARTAVEDTQNEYAKWNRPEFMRGPLKSMMFMFMQYQQNMVFQMYGGDKSWLRLLAMHLAIAGLMGLPFVGNLNDLVKWLSKMWGTKVDPEQDAREFLVSIGTNPDWVLNGASHNAFGVDLSGSLSMGRIIPGLEALAQEGKFSDRVLSGSTDISGAGISFAINVMQAIADDNPNTLLRFQRALPAAFQNLSKSAEIAEHGGRIDKTGAVVSELSTSDAMLQALGFNPAKSSTEMKEFHAKKQLVLYWQTRRATLMEQYWYAGYIANDREGLADVRNAIREFNASAPDRALMVTHDDISRSVKARQRAKLMREKGLTTQVRMHGMQAQLETNYITDER